MARYHRLSVREREELSRMLAAGYSLRATAQALKRAPSTLSRELTRHWTSPATYRAVPAHQRAQRWAHHPRKPRKLAVHPRLRRAVLTLLAQRWSPEQIARGLPQRYPDEPTMRISHEAIYTYLYVLPRGAFKRELVRYLRRRHRAQLRRSLTYDQGPEMREHRLFTKETKMRVYFAHPHAPWERGTNENTNGLLRQFFPKGTRFNQLSRAEIKRVQALFNDRPRKILNWHSPAHAFTQLLR